MRALCQGCERPPLTCICEHLVAVRPRTPVVVVQHPRERDNAIGTAWMVERSLGATRIVGVELEDDPAFVAAISDPAAPAILLSPGEDAIDLAEAPPTGPVTLVVVDGTWSQAKKLLRVNPTLARLPRYAFQPARPSNYRIRKEPADHCVSTIEATVAALEHLPGEQPEELRKVLAAFDAMVDHQIRIAAERSQSRHLHAAIARSEKKPKPARRLPLVLDELVVAYGESNAWPRGSEHGPYPEVVHFAAERLSTGERFEAFVRPSRPLSPGFAFHTQLPVERVLEGESRESFRARLAAFFRPGERLAVWGFHSVEVLLAEGHALPPRIDLRSTAIRFLGRRAGDVSQMVASFDRTPDVPWALGRTGVRQAAAATVARAISR